MGVPSMAIKAILCLALVAMAFGEGQIKLNKFVYKSICECVKPKNVSASPCRPTKKKIKMEDAGQAGGIAKDQIRDAIGNPQDLHFVKAKDHHFSCLDSRTSGEMIGTPGGDAGEFIL